MVTQPSATMIIIGLGFALYKHALLYSFVLMKSIHFCSFYTIYKVEICNQLKKRKEKKKKNKKRINQLKIYC